MLTRFLAGAVRAMVLIGCLGVAAYAGHESPAREGGEADASARLNPVTPPSTNFLGDMTIWTGVVFVVVFLILWKTAWGPISQGLQKRETEIANQISEAHQKNEDARKMLAEYEKRLAASQDEVRTILDKARRDAEQIGHDLVEKAKAEAVAEQQRSLAQIDAATNAALKELAERSASMAVDLAGKILRTKLDAKDHSRLVGDAVANFTARAGSTQNN